MSRSCRKQSAGLVDLEDPVVVFGALRGIGHDPGVRRRLAGARSDEPGDVIVEFVGHSGYSSAL